MFSARAKVWVSEAEEHVQEYIQPMLDSGRDELHDFQQERDKLNEMMTQVPKYSVLFMYYWSVRDYIDELIRQCIKI